MVDPTAITNSPLLLKDNPPLIVIELEANELSIGKKYPIIAPTIPPIKEPYMLSSFKFHYFH